MEIPRVGGIKSRTFYWKERSQLGGRWIKMHLLWGGYGYFLESLVLESLVLLEIS